jgi:exodeoxyribonuclease VII large subunit
MGRNLSRLIRFNIVDARTRVQEHALSQVFDEVRSRLRNAHLATNTALHRLQISTSQAMRSAQNRADALSRSLSPVQPRTVVSEARTRLDSAYSSCNSAMEKHLEESGKRLGLAAASLDALSPLAVLHRGYAIAQQEDGQLLRDARSVSIGDSVRVRLAKGGLATRVERIEET